MTLLLSAAAPACSSSSSTPGTTPPASGQVEIYTEWTAGGEAQALSSLISSFKTANPKDDVLNSTGSDATVAFATMNMRLANNNPPDAWQAILGANLISYTEFVAADAPASTTPVNKTEDLTDLYASEGWMDKIPPGVLAAMKGGQSTGIYAVPIDVGRINDLYYNKAIFTKYNLTPPTTLDELNAIGAALKGKMDDAGDPIIPMAMSAGYPTAAHNIAWPARFVFDAILMAEPSGIKFRQDYYSGVAKVDDPAYLKAATDFATFLTTYTNGGNADLSGGSTLPASTTAMRAAGMSADAQNVQWEDAADMIHSGRAAMFLHGDWVKSYLTSKGDALDVDFGVVQFPPKAFVYAGDSFVMAKDAPHHDAALAFLKTVGDPAVQSAFNALKGSLPARTDADTSMFDAFGQESAKDFADPTVTLVPCSWDYAPVDYWNCWGDAMETIMMNHDPAAFASACVDKYPLLKQ
ncbi:MAG TPA: extracellular solute-binding protein [Polyangiaceae bacterium]|nr:extracellular solute-binding protein [Polyangiaceae bacterium]